MTNENTISPVATYTGRAKTWTCSVSELRELLAENAKLRVVLEAARVHVYTQSEAEHMLDGFGPRRVRPVDALLASIDEVLAAVGE